MRICFVSNGRVEELQEEETDLILFGFHGMGEVRYEQELKGESNHFAALAKLSKSRQGVAVCGCVTNTHGHRRKSAVVAQNGRLLGVSDMLHTIDGEYSSGAELRVYETNVGKMGVLVAEDLYFPEAAKALTDCAADFIVCPFDKAEEQAVVVARALAFSYGTPIFLCSVGYCAVATPEGKVDFSATDSPAYTEYAWEKRYCLVERRLRGRFLSST